MPTQELTINGKTGKVLAWLRLFQPLLTTFVALVVIPLGVFVFKTTWAIASEREEILRHTRRGEAHIDASAVREADMAVLLAKIDNLDSDLSRLALVVEQSSDATNKNAKDIAVLIERTDPR